MELDVATKMKSIPEVSRVLLVPGFDLLIQFNDANLENRERQVREVQRKIREVEHIVNTRIIPVEFPAEESSDASKDTFAIIRVRPGSEKEILFHLLQFPDIRAAYPLPDENDLFIHVRSRGLNEIAAIIQGKMAAMIWVSDFDTLIPHLELSVLAPPIEVSPLVI